MKKNCWEFTKCGRQPGGERVGEMGVCPAATYGPANAYLGGINAGRACTYVTGTFCSNTVAGTHRDKAKRCAQCNFYQHLRLEEGAACSVLAFAAHVRDNDPGLHQSLIRLRTPIGSLESLPPRHGR